MLSSVRKYYLVFQLAVQDRFEYRFDFLMSTVKYSFMVLMVALVWLAVAKENPDLPLSPNDTVRYYFFSAIIYTLSNFHTNYIEDDIRLGELNKFLLKPITPYAYYFFYELASTLTATVIKMIVMIPMLWLLGLGFSISVSQLAIAALYLPLIFIFSYSMYCLISGLAFWVTEAYAIRWALTIFLRFISGILVPISFLPEWYQSISYWLPFQHLAFTPISVLQGTISLHQAFNGLYVLAIWTVVFNVLRFLQWRNGYQQFEGSGI